MIHSLETPLKMAHYLTDNRRLQAHLLQFFSIKDDQNCNETSNDALIAKARLMSMLPSARALACAGH